ncbi:MAG: hypothetical protein H7263_02950 [Candidatus Sericytochromatia bacterium]|nr:hypothetical protein [Candidatus Sericytochromatia bacterium]
MAIKGSFFNQNYLKTDIEAGTISNSGGNRVLFLTEDFLKGFKNSLKSETDEAYKIVLETCGKFWGQAFIKKFRIEVNGFYHEDLNEMTVYNLNRLIQDLWKYHGWGEININWKEAFSTGIFDIKIKNSAFADIIGDNTADSENIFKGMLPAIFSDLSGKDLECYQTSYQVFGNETLTTFVLGIPSRLKKINEMLKEELGHDEIVKKLNKTIS